MKARLALTVFLMVIFFWSWPVRLFTKKNNCYFWTLEKLITEGGKAVWYPSRRWAGYHVIWVSPEGEAYEYTIPRMRRDTPWWKMLFYDGSVRRFRNYRKDQ